MSALGRRSCVTFVCVVHATGDSEGEDEPVASGEDGGEEMGGSDGEVEEEVEEELELNFLNGLLAKLLSFHEASSRAVRYVRGGEGQLLQYKKN